MNSAFLICLSILLFAWTAVIALQGFGKPARLRFSVRDLLWLTLLCAVLAGWWMDYQQSRYNSLEERHKRAAEKVREYEAKMNAASEGRFERLNAEAAERAALLKAESTKTNGR
jgi:hypothetical protein